MHEASVARYVLDILNNTIREDKNLENKKVKSITFAISNPYTVSPDIFEFYYTYVINIKNLEENEKYIDNTCGLLGITKLFDIVSKDSTKIHSSISSLVHVMVRYTWIFSDKKKKIYLSGGLSENQLFINYLNKLSCNVVPIGRYTLIDGLKSYL